MKLKQLLQKIPSFPFQVKGTKEVLITGITSNSKEVAPGYLFIARKGAKDNGARYLAEAKSAGAVAAVTDIYNPFIDITQIIHPNPKVVESVLVANFFHHPANELLMVGITGTNGKTTTAFICRTLLNYLYGECGLIGTIEYIVGTQRYPATHTTPDVALNHKLLREMVQHGCRSAVMEVTSHALDQGRTREIDFDVAIYTNLTGDHLDYHLTMENYCLAKNRLFRELGKADRKKKFPVAAVVNKDCVWMNQIIQGCQAPLLTYGIDSRADLTATEIKFEEFGTSLLVNYKEQSIPCYLPLFGRFNVYNALAAIGMALSQNFRLPLIVDYMRHIPAVRGRLQPVENALGLRVFVDFAHSDDSLSNVLKTLRECAKGRIITVFGCGGDRDATKRPRMAEVSEIFSDFTIVTSDNSRNEDPENIANDIIKGFKSQDSYCVELDRRAAIKKAIRTANPGDSILIAGKGHETYQIFKHRTERFDDSEVAAEICDELQRSR